MPDQHPYREPGIGTTEEPPERTLPTDDIVLAAVLFVVGSLGICIGVSADRAIELTFGLILIALGARVAWDARNASG